MANYKKFLCCHPQDLSNKTTKMVCKLNKAIYGLKQAPRAWFQRLAAALCQFGFVSSKCDPSLFIRITPHSTTYVLVYVDDILITGNSSTNIHTLKHNLNKIFSLKDLGLLHYFLGIEVKYKDSGDIHLCQKKYIQDLLTRAHMDKAKPINTPMVTNLKLTKHGHDLM